MPKIEELQRYAQLTPNEKIDARISWLERKMVEVLWLLCGVTSMLIGGFAAFCTSQFMDTRSMWLLAPVYFVAWLGSGWLLERRTFRGAPPHIDFIDP
jgi:hypothetical protein